MGRSWKGLGGVLGRLGRQDRPRARGIRVLRPHGDRLGLHFGRFFGAFSHDFSIKFSSYLENPNFKMELAGKCLVDFAAFNFQAFSGLSRSCQACQIRSGLEGLSRRPGQARGTGPPAPEVWPALKGGTSPGPWSGGCRPIGISYCDFLAIALPFTFSSFL